MIYLISLTSNPGGSDCLNFSALSLSFRTSVYKYFEQRTLNFALLLFFFILTDLASVLLDIIINSLISFTCFAILTYLASVERKRIRLVSLINRPFSSLIILIDLLFDNLIYVDCLKSWLWFHYLTIWLWAIHLMISSMIEINNKCIKND